MIVWHYLILNQTWVCSGLQTCVKVLQAEWRSCGSVAAGAEGGVTACSINIKHYYSSNQNATVTRSQIRKHRPALRRTLKVVIYYVCISHTAHTCMCECVLKQSLCLISVILCFGTTGGLHSARNFFALVSSLVQHVFSLLKYKMTMTRKHSALGNAHVNACRFDSGLFSVQTLLSSNLKNNNNFKDFLSLSFKRTVLTMFTMFSNWADKNSTLISSLSFARFAPF